MAKNKRQMMVKIGDSKFDKILAYYRDPEIYKLTPALEEIRKRWVVVMTLRLKDFPKYKIVTMLSRDFGLSEAQAYNDIRDAENIFGNITKTDVEAEKQIWKEWIKDIRIRAKRNGDLKSELKAADLFAKYSDFGIDNPEFNPEKLENKEIRVVLPKEMFGLLEAFISKGVVDFNSLDATNVDFETVENPEDTDE